MGDKIRLEVGDHVAHVVLNRPEKYNALDGDCLELLERYFTRIVDDDAIRAVIVRGESKAFCTGADLGYLGDKVHDPVVFGGFLETWHRTYDMIASSPVPTIAAVHDLALAGGFELLQVCDLVVLADDARIGDQH